MNLQGIKNLAQNVIKWGKTNSQIILAGIGVAGLVGTAFTAAKGAMKAQKIIETENQKRKADVLRKGPELVNKPTPSRYVTQLTKIEMFKITWKCYIPSVIIGAGSIACIIGGVVSGQKKLAAMSALYSMSEQALKEYKEAAIETVGEKKANTIDDTVTDNKMKRTEIPDELVLNTGEGITLFFDEWTGRYFRSNIDYVKRYVNDCNSAIVHGDAMTLNEWYGGLGLPMITAGDEIGWDCDALIEMGYKSKLTDKDEPCVVLEFKERPRPLYV